MQLVLDIETIPTEDPDIVAEIAANITPPANYSKPDTIAKWEQESKPALVDAAVRKTSFDGTYGRVVVVGYAIGNEKAISISNEHELTMLADVAHALYELSPLDTVIGHNIAWDVRFLWQRYIVYNLTPPRIIAKAARAKPWEVEDTMLLWNPDRDRKISLANLCRALGVPTSKTDMDGSKVWDAWKAGEIERIAEYCRADVEATRACYLRMTA